MYNEFEEYSLKTKMDGKVWKRIFKEILKYPGYLIGAVLSMLICISYDVQLFA